MCTAALAIGLILAGGPLGAGDQAQQSPADAKLFGFNGAPIPGQYNAQRELSAPLRRMIINWEPVQPARDSWRWRPHDARYESLLNGGLRPLIVVVGSPCWAHPSTCASGGWHPPDPKYDPDWREFVTRVAQRYPQAVAVEVWNEPNLNLTFPPASDPERYAELLVDAYRSVKAVSPSVPVISGGLAAGARSGGYGIADAEFLAGVYAAGAAEYMDGIGIHPYPKTVVGDGTRTWDVPTTVATLDRVRAVRDGAGENTTPLWITEIGESTATQLGFPPAASEEQQASDLIALVRQVRTMSDVPVAIIHKLVDTDPSLDYIYAQIESGFGVYRIDGSPKPAACALSGELGGTLPCSTVLPDSGT